MHNNLTSRVDGSVPLFDGVRNSERRVAVERGEVVQLLPEFEAAFAKYTKNTPTFAVRMPFDYEVDTLEGRHFGQAGSYLAVGQAGEMYPIDAEIFENTYELSE